MKHIGLKLLVLTLFIAVALPLTAQETSSPDKPISKMPAQKKEPPKVSTEFGLSAGGLYSFMEVLPVNNSVLTQKVTGIFGDKLSGNLGAVGALQIRLNIGKSFGIQPEILFSHSTLKISGAEYKNKIKVKSNILQMPLLFSFRVAMFRFNFGPVFSLLDNPTYQLVDTSDNSIKTMPLGKLCPTITYTAGIGIKLRQRTLIDIRWAGQFKDIKSHNEFFWTLDKNEQDVAQRFRLRNNSIQVRLGVILF